MTTALIVQARYSSRRLPGKVLLSLGQRTVLEEVLRRCLAVKNADVVICATSDRPDDEPVAQLAERAGAKVFRGPLDDVLKRYRLAAESISADSVLRVTADCPLIDPSLCAEVIARRAAMKADYCANNMPPSFPHGLDCEAFTYAALVRADEHAASREAREHVTPWLRSDASVSRVNVAGPGEDAKEERWTLDYSEDLEFMREVFRILPQVEIPDWQSTRERIAAVPTLAAINSARRVVRD